MKADPAMEARIAALVKRMTVAEKVGQIVQADIAAVTPDEVRKYHLGSVLNGGNSAPGGNEEAPPAKWLELADAFYNASVDKTGGRTGIPMIWGTDAVHGHSNIVGATLFPHNIGLGAARDPALIERIGKATAIEIRTTGQEWTFAPTITVPQDFRWGRAFEGYSSDPKLVSSYVGAMIRGLQGQPNTGAILKGPHVIASTKHFLADGGTKDGRDQGDAQITEEELRDIHGTPYVPAIEAGVETVMTSFSSWNGIKIAGHHGLVTDVLKDRMNFGGFVVTDWNAHGQVAGCTNASCPQSLLAGIDMYMAPDSWRELYASLLAQANDGTIPMARLDDAVSRILRVKMRMGLFEAGKPSSRPLAGQFELLGSAEHRALAREAVRKSLVLLKNSGSVLPIKPGAKVLVAGDGAEDISRQAGGWSITWQGTGLTNAAFPGATSIWKALESAVSESGGKAEYRGDGSFTTKPDVAIVVFGETPYAEFQGDLKTLRLRAELEKPFETMRKLKAQGIPVVAVMITGRPLFVNPALNASDAFVVAWLPGSEGGGVADMLVAGRNGKPVQDFTGKLPTSWPATARVDGPTLFPFGYGLALAQQTPAAPPLSEDPGVAEVDAAGVFLDRGQPQPLWSLYVTDGGLDSTRISTVPATAVGGRVAITPTDFKVQEGARRFAVQKGAATIEISAHTSVDISRETNGDVLLVMTARRDSALAGKIGLTMRGGGKLGAIDAGALAELPQGEWVRVGVPLKCFAAAGVQMDKVDVPFSLSLGGPGTLSLARVALGTEFDRQLACKR
jgi:beta-glucosidase